MEKYHRHTKLKVLVQFKNNSSLKLLYEFRVKGVLLFVLRKLSNLPKGVIEK